MTDFRVVTGDALAEMNALEADSIDAVVADPPYGIGFMGHEWDQPAFPGRANGAPGRDEFASDAIAAGRYDHSIHGNRQFQAFSEAWARAALRVLKPGGFLLAFAGSRTYHRLASGVEDAGFDLRDQLLWLHGSGFPKSKKLGLGRGTALKPAHEPIALARKPLAFRSVTDNVALHGTGGLNVESCRVAFQAGDVHESELRRRRKPRQRKGSIRSSDAAYQEERAGESRGRWPANVILSHDPDCYLAGTATVRANGHFSAARKPSMFQARGHDDLDEVSIREETVEVWECVSGCPVAELDRQSGVLRSGEPGVHRLGINTSAAFGAECRTPGTPMTGYGDVGGASRFYYCAKASRSEREAGLEGFPARRSDYRRNESDESTLRGRLHGSVPRRNYHPTVKPIDLMRWLVRLITPAGGTVLDPFCGSGTTGCAAVLEERSFVGVERDPDYAAIAVARIAYWRPDQLSLLAVS